MTPSKDDSTAAPEAAELPYLSQANYLGQGFDITGTYELPESLILPVVDANKASWEKFEFQGRQYSIPSFCTAAIDTSGRYAEAVAATREQLQNSIAVTAKVAAGYGAFSGEMDASYGRDLTSSSEYDYAYVNYYARLAVLSMNLGVARTMLTKDFVERYEELPAEVSEETLEEFELFFHDYGMYVTATIAIGGSLEYTVAVNKESGASLTNIGANLKAEYNGVIFSGELSGSLTNTESWKRYSQNRKVSIDARGGDPTLISELVGTDVNNPATKTVTAYRQWVDSLKAAPAVADFSLTGVWELIPDKRTRKLLADAFTALQGTMRPRLTVETSWQTGWPPTITLGRSIRPEEPPKAACGFQMALIERSTLRRVALDKYYTAEQDAKHERYASLYGEIAGDIEEGGFNHPGMVIVLASFGVPFAAPPTSRLVPLLRSFGAGDALSMWIQKATPGLNMGYRCSYALVGIGGLGPRSGVEMIRLAQAGRIDELEVFFYRQRGVNTYSLALGERSADEPKRSAEEGPGRRSFLVSGPDHAYVEDAD
jgi:MAC/Perforin domain